MPKRYIRYLIIGFIVALIVTFYPNKKKALPQQKIRDYIKIKESGILRVVTEYNSLSYFVSGDSLKGYDYDLVVAFADKHTLVPEITPEMSNEQRIRDLIEGKYDLLALPLPITTELKDSISLTNPIVLSNQILVQRRKDENKAEEYIESLLQLSNKTLHVVHGSPSILRLKHLSSEIGDTIYICEIEKYGEEQLLSMVAHNDIDYLVCDQNIAYASHNQFPQLDFDTPISFTQFYAWGVNKHSPALLASINQWLESINDSPFYKEIYQKYYSQFK